MLCVGQGLTVFHSMPISVEPVAMYVKNLCIYVPRNVMTVCYCRVMTVMQAARDLPR